MAPGGRRTMGSKPSIQEQLEKWRIDKDGMIEMVDTIMQADKASKESVGFQWHSQSTIDRRDRHLREFLSVLEVRADKLGKTFDEDFKWGPENIQDNVRFYIEYSAMTMQAGSYAHVAPRFSTLVQRRQSILFYANRNCGDAVSRPKLLYASQEALHYVSRKWNLSTEVRDKLYLTKYDMILLLEDDMWLSQAPEVAEQQHLCWLLGFVLGVRPGSIGFSKKRKDQYLQWKDIQLMRWKGNNFRVKITFRWLKGHRDEEKKSLVFNCIGPKTVEEVMYSIPHRIMAIALRRGLLEDYQDLDSALDSGEGALTNIRIKQEALELPVVLAAEPKGFALIPGKAGSANGISDYLQRVALRCGYPRGMTHYAWRRSFATNAARELGVDQARLAMGHEPNLQAGRAAKDGTTRQVRFRDPKAVKELEHIHIRLAKIDWSWGGRLLGEEEDGDEDVVATEQGLANIEEAAEGDRVPDADAAMA